MSVVRDSINVTEGSIGSFCVAIEDTTVQLDRPITINLSTAGGSAKGISLFNFLYSVHIPKTSICWSFWALDLLMSVFYIYLATLFAWAADLTSFTAWHIFCFNSIADDDYMPVDRDVMVNSSNRDICLEILTLHDFLVEPSESFSVVLGSTDPALIIGHSISTGIIIDQDCKLTLR